MIASEALGRALEWRPLKGAIHLPSAAGGAAAAALFYSQSIELL